MSSRKRTPDQQPANPEPQPDATAAVAEPPAAANDNKPSFAERVGQRNRITIPDPFGIAGDYLAGVRLFESKQPREMAIKFDDKPGQAVIDRLKEAGYRWNPEEKVWNCPVRPESAMSTRIEAERLYQEIRQMVRQEKGIEASPEIPF